MDLIDVNLMKDFDFVRNTRKKYLHLYSQDHDDLPNDAVEVYKHTLSFVVNIIGQDFENGKLKLRPELAKYLEEHEIITKA